MVQSAEFSEVPGSLNTQPGSNAGLLLRGVDPAPRWNRTDVILAGGLILLGLALRLPGINQGLWIDEIITLVDFVRSSAWSIISTPGRMNNHVLYSLSAHYSTAWFGESIWALRLPALIFGIAAIPALYQLGRQLASRQEAFLAALFLAVNYQFIWYSGSARGYTGLLAGALLSTVLFIRLVGSARPSWRLILAYAVVASLTAWIHLTAVCVIVVHGLVWLSLATRQVAARRIEDAKPAFMAFLLTGIFIFACYSTLLFEDTVQHIERGNSGLTTLEAPPDFSWVASEFVNGLNVSMPGGIAAVLVVLAVLTGGSVSYSRQGWRIACLLLLPILVTFTLVWERGAILFPRFMIGSSGFLLLVGVRGGFTLAGLALPFLSRRLVLAAGIGIALVSLSVVPRAWEPKQDYVAAAAFLDQNQRPGDLLACVSPASFALRKFLGLDCIEIRYDTEMALVENQKQRTWMIYTLPKFLPGPFPEIHGDTKVWSGFRVVANFPGSLNGGAIKVLFRDRLNSTAGALNQPIQIALNSERIRSRYGNYAVELLEQDQDYRVTNLFTVDQGAKTTRTLAVVLNSWEGLDAAPAEREAIREGGSIGEVFKNAGWAIRKVDLYFGELEPSADYANLYSMMGGIAPQALAVHVYDLWVSKDSERFRYATLVEVHHPDYLNLEALRQIYQQNKTAVPTNAWGVEREMGAGKERLRNLPPRSESAGSPGFANDHQPASDVYESARPGFTGRSGYPARFRPIPGV